MWRRVTRGLSRNRYLVAILTLAFVLMTYGIWVRAPHVMGPDEKTAVTKSLWMGVNRTPFIPDFNKGGNLYLYVLATSFVPVYLYLLATGRTGVLAEQASRASTFFDAPPELKSAFYDFLLAGRLLSVLIGLVTVYLIYVLARDLYGERAGLFAASSFGVSLGAANVAHYATEDALLTGLIALTFVLLSRYHVTGDYRFLTAASVAAGLSVSTKATAGFLLVPMAYVVARDNVEGIAAGDLTETTTVVTRLVANGSVAFVAYLLTTPSILAFPGLYLSDLLGEATRTGTTNAQFVAFPGWLLRLFNLAWGFGLPLFLVSVAGLGWVVVRLTDGRENRTVAAILLFLASYYLVVGSWRTHEVWYTAPLMPLLAVFAGAFVDRLLDGEHRRLAAVFVAGVLVFSLVYTGATVQRTTDEARAEASAWIDGNVEPGTDIDVYRYPLQLPGFPSDVDVHNLWFNSTAEEDWRIASERVRCRSPDYIVLTSGHYAFFVRHPEASPEISAFYDRLLSGEAGYERVATFGPPLRRLDSLEYRLTRTVVPSSLTYHGLRIVVLERQAPPASCSTAPTGSGI